jgi:hypothetical protein
MITIVSKNETLLTHNTHDYQNIREHRRARAQQQNHSYPLLCEHKQTKRNKKIIDSN